MPSSLAKGRSSERKGRSGKAGHPWATASEGERRYHSSGLSGAISVLKSGR
jgi:hypothetical protein